MIKKLTINKENKKKNILMSRSNKRVTPTLERISNNLTIMPVQNTLKFQFSKIQIIGNQSGHLVIHKQINVF